MVSSPRHCANARLKLSGSPTGVYRVLKYGCMVLLLSAIGGCDGDSKATPASLLPPWSTLWPPTYMSGLVAPNPIEAPLTVTIIARSPMCPHKWVVGSTFEYYFDFPMPTNPAKTPTPSRKTSKKSSKTTSSPTKRRKQAAPKKAGKSNGSTDPELPAKATKVKPTRQEQQESLRASQAHKRANRKERGLCKDCPNPVIEGLSRCQACRTKRSQNEKRNREQRTPPPVE